MLGFPLIASTALTQTHSATTQSKSTTDQIIHFYQAKVSGDPDDFLNYDRLSGAYIQKARETGDISYYELAEKGLRKSLQLESTHEEAASAFVELAAVYFAEHRFREAAADAEKASKLAPDALTAYATEGDAYFETGDYDRAAAIYRHFDDASATKAGDSAKYLKATRWSSLDWIHGRPELASQRLVEATTIAGGVHLHAENIAWTYFMLAEQYFQSGDLQRAQAATRESLRIFPGYHRALAEMGKIQAAQGRIKDAIESYKQALTVIPLPVYAAALGDLYKKIGSDSEAEKQYALVEYIAKIGALNQQVYNRELAVFYADHGRHLPEALTLAKKELEVRHDVYTWDALSWVLLKNGQAQAAHDAMQKALALGTQDALLFFHAAAIERELRDNQWADYARRALALNPQFHVFYAEQAKQWLSASGRK
jgi:tetratricopeptide (TPR) repeat protein